MERLIAARKSRRSWCQRDVIEIAARFPEGRKGPLKSRATQMRRIPRIPRKPNADVSPAYLFAFIKRAWLLEIDASTLRAGNRARRLLRERRDGRIDESISRCILRKREREREREREKRDALYTCGGPRTRPRAEDVRHNYVTSPYCHEIYEWSYELLIIVRVPRRGSAGVIIIAGGRLNDSVVSELRRAR